MISVLVTDESSIGEARRQAKNIAIELAFSETETESIAIIATELAKNLIKHTPHGGEILIQGIIVKQSYRTINLFSLDKGPGIPNIDESLQDGYSTAGTPGTGLGAIQRLSSHIEIFSCPRSGTILWSQLTLDYLSKKKINTGNLNQAGSLNWACICVPVKGETLCGDAYVIETTDSNTLHCLVADGLGHGAGAHEASNEAVKAFTQSIAEGIALDVTFDKIHKALNKTRGAAAAVAALNFAQSKLEYIGIGNIAGTLFSKDIRKSLVSLGGIVGHGIKKIQTFTYPLPSEFLLTMYSDGLISHWDLKQNSQLFNQSASVIAAALYRDYKRDRDDVTVMVIKNK